MQHGSFVLDPRCLDNVGFVEDGLFCALGGALAKALPASGLARTRSSQAEGLSVSGRARHATSSVVSDPICCGPTPGRGPSRHWELSARLSSSNDSKLTVEAGCKLFVCFKQSK